MQKPVTSSCFPAYATSMFPWRNLYLCCHRRIPTASHILILIDVHSDFVRTLQNTDGSCPDIFKICIFCFALPYNPKVSFSTDNIIKYFTN